MICRKCRPFLSGVLTLYKYGVLFLEVSRPLKKVRKIQVFRKIEKGAPAFLEGF